VLPHCVGRAPHRERRLEAEQSVVLGVVEDADEHLVVGVLGLKESEKE
jgi:hypothetical protein